MQRPGKAHWAAIVISALFLIWQPADANQLPNRTVGIVIDRSGSMANEIAALQRILRFQMEDNDWNSQYSVTYYVSTFHQDPNDTNPNTVPQVAMDTQSLLDFVEELYATGGGDCADAVMSGILKMLRQMPSYSRLIVFTDSTANDYFLLDQVLALIQQKRIKVYIILSDDCEADRNAPEYSSLDSVTSLSSGLLIRTDEPKLGDKSDYDTLFNYFTRLIAVPIANEHNLLVRDFTLEAGRKSETFQVWMDRSVKRLQLVTAGVNVSVMVTAGGMSEIESETSVTKVANMMSMEWDVQTYGWWNFEVIGSSTNSDSDSESNSNSNANPNSYSVRALAIYDNKLVWNWQHFFVREIDGRAIESLRPISGVLSYVTVNVTDSSVKPSELQLLHANGTIFSRFAMTKMRSAFVSAKFQPPADSFYLQIIQAKSGKADGDMIQRFSVTGLQPIDPTPPAINITEGNNEVICSVISQAPFTIKWFLNGKRYGAIEHFKFTSVAKFTLHNLNEAQIDDGHVMCVASNVAGSTNSSLYVTVPDGPVIMPVSDTVMQENTDAWFACEAQNSGELWWTFNGLLLNATSKKVVYPNGTLFIKNMTKRESGNYSCYVKSDERTASMSFHVLVYSLPKVTKIRSSKSNFTAGDSFTLDCLVETDGNVNSSVTWLVQYPNSGLKAPLLTSIRDGVTVEGTRVAITNANVDNAGPFTCKLEDQFGNSDRKEIDLIYYELPKVNLEQTYLLVARNSNLLVPCTTSGTPLPTTQWLRRNKVVNIEFQRNSNSSFVQKFDNGSLYLANAQPWMAGEWVCEAASSFGKDRISINLDIGAPASVDATDTKFTMVIEGTAVMSCGASGDPAPIITWSKLSSGGRWVSPLSSRVKQNKDGTLSISEVDQADEGTYQCFAANQYGNASTMINATVSGIELPIITATYPEVNAVEWTAAMVSCEVLMGNPKPIITWQRIVNQTLVPIAQPHSVYRNGSLLLGNVTKEREGLYQCTATNIAGNSTAEVVFIVQVPPKFITELPANTTALLGDEVTLACAVTGSPPPSVSWSRNGVPVTSSSTDLGENLIETVYQSANYTCKASNDAGNSSLTVAVIVTDGLRFTQSWKPRLAVQQGETLRLECNAESRAPINYSLRFAGRALSEKSTRFQFSNNSPNVILISSADYETHQGVYSCVASTNISSINQTMELLIQAKPWFDDGNTTKLDVQQFEDLQLFCNAFGYPEVSVEWQFQSVSIDYVFESNRYELSSDRKTLILKNATTDLIGEVTCIAQNSLGSVNKTFAVDVLVPLWIDNSSLVSNYTVKVGDPMELVCPIEGTGPISYAWFLNGSPANIDNDEVFQDGKLLVFTRVSLANAGEYMCRANNSFSQNQIRIRVAVWQDPFLVNYTTWDTLYEVQLGYNFTLRCPAAGVPVPLVYWYMDGVLLNLSASQLADHKLDIINISRSSDRATFKYVCVATSVTVHNDFDLPEEKETVRSFTFELDVYAAPILRRGMQANSTIELESDGSERHVTLVCPFTAQFDVDGTVTYSWFQDGRAVGEDVDELNVTTRLSTLIECLAENKGGSRRGRFDVRVSETFRFLETEVSNEIYAEINGSLVLSCATVGGKSTRTKWTKQRELPEVSGSREDGYYMNAQAKSLVLPRIKLDDSGKYQCVLSDEKGNLTREFLVFVKPFIDGPGDLVVELGEGQSSTLDCRAVGRPAPDIQWQTNATGFTQLDLTRQSLQVTGMRKSYEGVYVCRATSAGGSAERRIVLRMVANWSQWAVQSCSVTCGNGLARRVRQCLDRSGSRSSLCVGSSEETVTCSMPECPVRPRKLIAYVTGSVNRLPMNKRFTVEWDEQCDVRVRSDRLPSAEVKRFKHFAMILMQSAAWVAACEVDGAENGYSLTSALFRQSVVVMLMNSSNVTVVHDGFGMVNETVYVNVSINGVAEFPVINLELNNVNASDEWQVQLAQGKISTRGNSTLDSTQTSYNYGWVSSIAATADENNLQPNVRLQPTPTQHLRLENFSVSVGVEGRYRVLNMQFRPTVRPAADSGCPVGYREEAAVTSAGTRRFCDDVDECVEEPPRCGSVCVNTVGSYHCSCRDGYRLAADRRTCENINECASASSRLCRVYEQCVDSPGSYVCVSRCEESQIFEDNVCKGIPKLDESQMLNGTRLSVAKGSSVLLPCPILAVPFASVAWFKLNRRLLRDNRRLQQQNFSLLIKNANVGDTGIYICQAQNVFGTVNVSVELQVFETSRWTEWSGWSSCSATCGAGVQQRTRTCVALNSSYTARCDGDSRETVQCNLRACVSSALGSISGSINGGFNVTIDPSCQMVVTLTLPRVDQAKTFEILAIPLTSAVSWLFACENNGGQNGLSLTDGQFLLTSNASFGSSTISISQRGRGVNADGDRVMLDIYVRGSLPKGMLDASRIPTQTDAFEESHLQVDSGVVNTRSIRAFMSGEASFPFVLTQNITSNATDSYGQVRPTQQNPAQMLSVQEARVTPFHRRSRTIVVRLVPSIQPIGCPTGFGEVETDGQRYCRDVDECAENNEPSLCPQLCENTIGSYVCRCKEGFTEAESRECRDVDECLNPNTCGSGQRCVNIEGSYLCEISCAAGQRNVDGVCRDIDECAEATESLCPGENNECVNTPGSFVCRCATGFQLGRSRKCVDINECRANNFTCPPSVGCVNTIGSYLCQGCATGFEQKSDGSCADINECFMNTHNCPRTHRCVNNRGGFNCTRHCGDGFESKNNRCVDVDECVERPSVCKDRGYDRCSNRDGSYECKCRTGYEYSPFSGRCEDYDECAHNKHGCGNSTCVNTDSSYQCACPQGYWLNPGNNCFDINECEDGTATCAEQELCHNLPGSYECRPIPCPAGTRLVFENGQMQCDPDCSADRYSENCTKIDVSILSVKVNAEQLIANLSIHQLKQNGSQPSSAVFSMFKIDSATEPKFYLKPVGRRPYQVWNLRTNDTLSFGTVYEIWLSGTGYQDNKIAFRKRYIISIAARVDNNE